MDTTPVILLPGAVLPAELAYKALIEAFGPSVDARPKELEVYATDAPRGDYALTDEVDGLLGHADAAGFETFHAVGYSSGGAVVLAAAARASDRFRSLGLLETAWAGWDLGVAEAAMWARLDDVMRLPPAERMGAFMRLELAPGVPMPEQPPGPAPEWMAKRPAGLQALTGSWRATDLDISVFRSYVRPVYYALGDLSHPDLYAQTATRLAGVFPDFTLERFAARHHFDPPHRTEPDRVARSLLALWARTDARAETG